MKNILIVIMMLCVAPAFGQIKSATLTASGLTCSMCSKSIFKALEKVSFIDSIDVDIEKSSYQLRFKPNAKVVLDDIKKAVTGAGFSVASLKVTAGFDKTTIANDAHIEIGGSTFHFLNVPNQTLDGDKTLTILDKNYLTMSEHKKYSKFTKMKCYETGVMGSCCPKDRATANRVYHVTL